MAEQSLPRTDTGSLAGDLRANARLVQRTLTDPRQGPLFKAVIAAATSDPRTAEALHGFYQTRIREWAPCVDLAVERGEVPEGTDPDEVIRAVSAPLYYRLLASGDPLDEAAADTRRRAAAAAARAGVFMRRPAEARLPPVLGRSRRPETAAPAETAAPGLGRAPPGRGPAVTPRSVPGRTGAARSTARTAPTAGRPARSPG